MMKEKTCVYIGIFLILALLCSCTLFYSMSDSAAVAVRPESAAEDVVTAISLFSAPGAELPSAASLFSMRSGG